MFRIIATLSILCLVAVNGSENEDRIVNGRTASIQEHPYAVSLLRNGGHFCGGSIINKNWILTAAHCLVDFISNALGLQVVVGSSSWLSGGTVKSAALAINHPEYNPTTMKFDCGLVQIFGEFTWGNTIKPVKICQNLPAPGTDYTVCGWGKLGEKNDKIPTILQAVEVSHVPLKECSSNKFRYGNAVMETMFCATAHAQSKDSCQGDSGGPLTKKGTHEQCGVVSWGYGCAQPGLPGVYTDLTHSRVRGFIVTYTGS